MNFKKISLIALSLAAVLIIGASPALAAGKPAEVIAKSNGFPSGMHFNLNIHGQDLSLDDPCAHEAGGNSVFIDLYGTNIIQYQSGRKMSGTELVAIDPCASGDDKVSIQLPSKVLVYNDATMLYDEVPVAGYHVYGRLLGKPQNGENDSEGRSNIVFSPNVVTEAYNQITEGDTLVNLGLITWSAQYYAGTDAYYRFLDPDATARGKSTARDMSFLFTFTGWVVDASLDTNGPIDDGLPDGAISIWDVPLGDYDQNPLTPNNRDFNNDTVEDDLDVTAWLQSLDSSLDPAVADLVTFYPEGTWIFNIADFVTTEGEVTNDGARLFQVRFYPYFE